MDGHFEPSYMLKNVPHLEFDLVSPFAETSNAQGPLWQQHLAVAENCTGGMAHTGEGPSHTDRQMFCAHI